MIELLAQHLLQRAPRELELSAKHQAALAVILTPNDETKRLDLLLIQRAERAGDPWSGHMALPGGRREPSDPDLDATAVRETREETGIDLTRARGFGALDDVQPIRQSERALVVRPFVFLTSARPALELSSEVAHALWVPLGELDHAAGEVDVDHRGGRLRVPAYRIGDRVVWGMTQRVVAGLLAYGVR
ncbi:MAG TPA: CoA pyrophosphatase [Planctomycetota bacterium]|nr:CoA pyrophosphatase [Planctomycetota bacterium]